MPYRPASDREKKSRPEYLARKGEGQMDKDEFRAVVQQAISDSVQYVDTELSPDRAKATKYYLGEPFGNEEEGRSQVVLTEVRDAVDGMLPSLLRVFFGSEHTVEFVPTRADNVQQAEQKTDYVRYVFEEDNAGFLRTVDVLKDGLIRRIGIFKWGWDDSLDTQAYKLEGITKQELEALAADDDVELTNLEKLKPTKQELADHEKATEQYQQQVAQMKAQPPQPGAPPPQVPPAPELPELYDVELTRTVTGGRARVWSVPPEEFIYNREARSIEEALLVGHRTFKTRGQLIAMGISEEDIDEHGGAGDGDASLTGNEEELARRDVINAGQSNDPEMGEANDKILYVEIAQMIDFNGDGRAELRRICTIGPGFYPVKNDPTDEKGFAIFTPYPEPHALMGGSVADRTMDVQKINSALLRGMLDSLSASIFPRTVYMEGQASVADIMNTAIGAPIRERIAGAVRTLEMPFVGKEAMPILGFMQEVVERRTGRNKGAAGLDADALQSTGKEAVGAVLTGSQEQLEMIARVFAEGTLKPLFKGLGRLLTRKQPRARMVRLRGSWTDVDPRTWDDSMDVTVNIGLGATFTDKKIATLMAVAADQKDMMMNLGGLANPVVPLPKYMNTRAKILALQGLKDFTSYYNALPADWQPPAPAAPPPSPEEMWMKTEKEMAQGKIVKELAIKQDELTLKREEAAFDREFRIRELATNAALKRYEIEANTHLARTQAELDRDVDTQAKETELAMQAHDQLHDQSIERQQVENEREAATATETGE